MSKLKIASAITHACAVATAVLAAGAAVHLGIDLEAKAPKAVSVTTVQATHKISYAFLETLPYTNRYAIRLMLAYDMWTKMFEEADVKVDTIGGHGPASPYDEPLIAETNYSAQLRYELETPVRQAKEVDKAYDKT